MAGRQIIGIQCQRIVQQPVKANMPIAFQAWIGRQALAMLVDEILDNPAPKDLLRIQRVKGNAEFVGDAAGIVHLARRAALIVGRSAH